MALGINSRPTSKRTGAAKVVVSVPSGLRAATGRVTLVLQKSGTTKTVVKTLTYGSATLVLPKLAKGSWRLVVRYSGDTNYRAALSAPVTLRVLR